MTNTATAIKAELNKRGVRLRAAGDRLLVDFDTPLPEPLLEVVHRHKDDLLTLLRPSHYDADTCPCGRQVWAFLADGDARCDAHTPTWMGGSGLPRFFLAEACGDCGGNRHWEVVDAHGCVACQPHPLAPEVAS